MREGAAQLFPPIVTSPDDFASANDNSAHRHFTTGSGFFCLLQRYKHVPGVFKIVIGQRFHQDHSTIAQDNSQENSAAHYSRSAPAPKWGDGKENTEAERKKFGTTKDENIEGAAAQCRA